MTAKTDWGRFELLTPEVDTRAIRATSQGLAGSGKSHFWLTAPGPIAWFLFDPGGLKGLRNNPLFENTEVRVRDYCGDLNIGKLPKEERIAASLAVLEQFQEDWDLAIQHARTLVIDKESLLWECVRYAHDEVSSPTPKNFHELNLLYRGWIQDAEINGKNLGLIRDMSDTWGKIGVSREGKPQLGFTGKMKPDGQKYATGLVDINLEHRWDSEESLFMVKILEKCRLGNATELMGQELPNLDFLTLATLLYPDSAPEEWGFE